MVRKLTMTLSPCAILLPMKLPLRIVLPFAAAVIVTGGILTLLWWQIDRTQDQLQRRIVQNQNELMPLPIAETDAGDVRDDAVLTHLRQGDLSAIQGEWEPAETEYKAAVDAGGDVAALRKLAQARMQRRKYPDAKATIDRLRRAGARQEDVLLLQTTLLLRTGELVQAREILEGAGDSPQKHYGLSLLAIIQGDHETAKTELAAVETGWDPTLRAYARAIRSAYDEFATFPQGKTIHLTTLLARTLAQVQECELALPLLSQVVQEQDDYRDAWTVQGYCQLTSERYVDAEQSFQRAYGIDPEKAEIQYFLGRTYLALKDSKNAVTFLQYALQNGFEPKKEVRMKLAAAALASGDQALAWEQYDIIARESDVELPTVEKLITLSITMGKKQEALAFGLAAVSRWPTEARAYDLLGWAEAENGKKEEAKKDLEKALQIDPTLASARERLSKL